MADLRCEIVTLIDVDTSVIDTIPHLDGSTIFACIRDYFYFFASKNSIFELWDGRAIRMPIDDAFNHWWTWNTTHKHTRTQIGFIFSSSFLFNLIWLWLIDLFIYVTASIWFHLAVSLFVCIFFHYSVSECVLHWAKNARIEGVAAHFHSMNYDLLFLLWLVKVRPRRQYKSESNEWTCVRYTRTRAQIIHSHGVKV